MLKISEQLRGFFNWAFPTKLILSATLGVLGGAGFLGYVSEYATYSYAIYHGIRPPLEGIPYLKATVAFGSIFLLLTGAAVFLISIVIVRFIIWVTEWLFHIALRMPPASVDDRFKFHDVAARLASYSFLRLLLIATTVGLFAAVFFYAEFSLLDDFLAAKLNAIFGKEPKPFPTTSASVIFGIYAFLTTFVIANRKAIWWLAVVATATYFFGWIGLLFSPNYYSGFLRLVGYGGGLKISIEARDVNSFSQSNDYFLLLRTTEAFIVLDATRNKIVELPRDQIKNITHEVGGLRKIPYHLPGGEK